MKIFLHENLSYESFFTRKFPDRRYLNVTMVCVYCIIQVYSGAHGRTMIFTRTKAEANELALSSSLKQDCQVLHGDIQQKQREITLKVGKHVYTCK